MENLKLPDLTPDWDDYVKSILRVAVGFVPDYGSGLSELISYLPSSSQERLIRFYRNLVNAINYLNDRDKSLVDRLKTDEAFVSFLTEVWDGHRKNHQEQKHEFLGNTIVNYPLAQIPFDRKRRFVILASELSIAHIDILKMIKDFRNNRHIVYLDSYKDIHKRIIADLSFDPNNPEITIEDFKVILAELQDRRLIEVSDDMKDRTDRVRMQITPYSRGRRAR